LTILAAGYCAAIVPLFIAPIAVLPLYLFAQRQLKLSIRTLGMICLVGFPSMIWLRSIFELIPLVDGSALDGIMTRFVLPQFNDWSYLAQNVGFVSWHAGGQRFPISESMFPHADLLGKLSINTLPVLTFFGVSLFGLLFISYFRFIKSTSPNNIFILLFVLSFLVSLATKSPELIFTHIMTIFPATLLAILINRKDKLNEFLVVAIAVATLFSTANEILLWYRNPTSPISQASGFGNSLYAESVNNALAGDSYRIVQGDYSNGWIKFVAVNELIESKEKTNCVNCAQDHQGYPGSIESAENSLYSVVILGNCPLREEKILVIGPYTMCSRN
jgi:hypothetical protein